MAASRGQEAPERVAARRWFTLAVGSLIVAGLLALLLVVARLPLLSGLFREPAFFKRCLVVHVDLSLVVWFGAFIAGQSFLLLPRGVSSVRSRYGVWLSSAGVLVLLLSTGAGGAAPILANYVPVVDHWSFALGLVTFGAGVLVSITDTRLLPPRSERPGAVLPLATSAAAGLRAALLALLVTALTFAASYASPLRLQTPEVAYELLHWGGGHVLMLATSLAMVAAWLMLVTRATGTPPLSRRVAALLFALMLVPWLGAPLFALSGVESASARQAFTELMRFGIFPGVLLALFACVRALSRGGARRKLGLDPRVTGFAASAFLTLLGYVLGALIRGPSTMVPAHYHACIGAVTVAFMTLAFELVAPLGLRVPRGKLAAAVRRYQPLVFGVGQSVFAAGFAIAGAHGAGRKTYGAEQQVQSASEALGLTVMAAGGVLAVISGVAFLAYLSAAWSAAQSFGVSHERASIAQSTPLAARPR